MRDCSDIFVSGALTLSCTCVYAFSLAVSATKFDRTELIALGIAFPILFLIFLLAVRTLQCLTVSKSPTHLPPERTIPPTQLGKPAEPQPELLSMQPAPISRTESSRGTSTSSEFSASSRSGPSVLIRVASQFLKSIPLGRAGQTQLRRSLMVGMLAAGVLAIVGFLWTTNKPKRTWFGGTWHLNQISRVMQSQESDDGSHPGS